MKVTMCNVGEEQLMKILSKFLQDSFLNGLQFKGTEETEETESERMESRYEEIRRSRLEEVTRAYNTCKSAYALYMSARNTLIDLLQCYQADYQSLVPADVLRDLDRELNVSM